MLQYLHATCQTLTSRLCLSPLLRETKPDGDSEFFWHSSASPHLTSQPWIPPKDPNAPGCWNQHPAGPKNVFCYFVRKSIIIISSSELRLRLPSCTSVTMPLSTASLLCFDRLCCTWTFSILNRPSCWNLHCYAQKRILHHFKYSTNLFLYVVIKK